MVSVDFYLLSVGAQNAASKKPVNLFVSDCPRQFETKCFDRLHVRLCLPGWGASWKGEILGQFTHTVVYFCRHWAKSPTSDPAGMYGEEEEEEPPRLQDQEPLLPEEEEKQGEQEQDEQEEQDQ